jgi:hypothetical protein
MAYGPSIGEGADGPPATPMISALAVPIRNGQIKKEQLSVEERIAVRMTTSKYSRRFVFVRRRTAVSIWVDF